MSDLRNNLLACRLHPNPGIVQLVAATFDVLLQNQDDKIQTAALSVLGTPFSYGTSEHDTEKALNLPLEAFNTKRSPQQEKNKKMHQTGQTAIQMTSNSGVQLQRLRSIEIGRADSVKLAGEKTFEKTDAPPGLGEESLELDTFDREELLRRFSIKIFERLMAQGSHTAACTSIWNFLWKSFLLGKGHLSC